MLSFLKRLLKRAPKPPLPEQKRIAEDAGVQVTRIRLPSGREVVLVRHECDHSALDSKNTNG